MMADREASVEAAETADEYGRREPYFLDSRNHPFCFEPCIPKLQMTMIDADEDEDGLFDWLPSPAPMMDDVFELREDLVQSFLELPPYASLKAPPLIPGLDIYQNLLVPVESLALPSDPQADLLEYFEEISAIRFSRPLETWLPLSSVSVENDEGLPLPSHSLRLRSLMQREAENEKLVLPEEALVHLEELYRSSNSRSVEVQSHLYCLTRHQQVHHAYTEPVTPPLFPISDNGSPFIPGNSGNIIDLTSEPSSPVNEQDVRQQKTLEEEDLGPEPIEPLSLLDSSPSETLPCVKSSHWRCRDLAADVPIMPSSSDPPCVGNPLANFLSPIPIEAGSLTPPNKEEIRSEDAFKALLSSRATLSKNRTEQEVLNPLDSTARFQVPILDFEIPALEWTTENANAQSHPCWLKDHEGACFSIPFDPIDRWSQSTLRWNPIAPEQVCVSIEEELPCSIESAQAFLMDVVPTLSSSSFFPTGKGMRVLVMTEDNQLDYPSPPPADERPQSPRPSSRRDWGKTEFIDPRQGTQTGFLMDQDWLTILGSLPKEVRDVETNLLPNSSDTSATSALVSSFMQLQGEKSQPQTRKPIVSGKGMTTSRTQVHALPTIQEAPFPVLEIPKVPATAPDFQVPAEKGSFIVSISLGRSLLSQLEAVWPSTNFFDMDFSRYTRVVVSSPGTGKPEEAASTLSYEADISLTPGAGVIVTNLLKIRQRALPGSNALAPLRERVMRVSQKYETLTVLVSEANPVGEYAGVLSPSDAASYADFVGFIIALDGHVHVYFVPGADVTLAKWLLFLMCQASHQAAQLKRFLSGQDTPWELFLRQAGMNVVAAKVLAGSLCEESGPLGLARFLITPAEERVSKFAAMLGGEKILRSSSEVLDQQWREKNL